MRELMGRKRRVIVFSVYCLCFITIFGSCKEKKDKYSEVDDYDYVQFMQDYERIVRPKSENLSNFVKPFPNDFLQIDSIYYNIPVDVSTHCIPIKKYLYSFVDNENSQIIFRSNILSGDPIIWVNEYRSEDWHVYVRLRRHMWEGFYGFIIKWKNTTMSINNSKTNWNIDEQTDTLYSTLPKEVILRELPKFKGIYKYLPVKQINVSEKQVINYTDTTHYNIEFIQ